MTTRLGAALTALAVATLAAPSPAQASHYRFDRIELVTRAEQRALSDVGIWDTRALLRRVAGLSGRVWLSRATRIDLERLTDLATQCDLLRVEGIGPSMVGVLQDAGVQDTRGLARAHPTPLLEAMRGATQGTALRYRLPNEQILATWISASRRLGVVVDDIPEPAPDAPDEAARRR